MSLQEEVLGKDLGILVDAAVLDDGSRASGQFMVRLQAVCQEEDL